MRRKRRRAAKNRRKTHTFACRIAGGARAPHRRQKSARRRNPVPAPQRTRSHHPHRRGGRRPGRTVRQARQRLSARGARRVRQPARGHGRAHPRPLLFSAVVQLGRGTAGVPDRPAEPQVPPVRLDLLAAGPVLPHRDPGHLRAVAVPVHRHRRARVVRLSPARRRCGPRCSCGSSARSRATARSR
jgi:hypothetical protein